MATSGDLEVLAEALLAAGLLGYGGPDHVQASRREVARKRARDVLAYLDAHDWVLECVGPGPELDG